MPNVQYIEQVKTEPVREQRQNKGQKKTKIQAFRV